MGVRIFGLSTSASWTAPINIGLSTRASWTAPINIGLSTSASWTAPINIGLSTSASWTAPINIGLSTSASWTGPHKTLVILPNAVEVLSANEEAERILVYLWRRLSAKQLLNDCQARQCSGLRQLKASGKGFRAGEIGFCQKRQLLTVLANGV